MQDQTEIGRLRTSCLAQYKMIELFNDSANAVEENLFQTEAKGAAHTSLGDLHIRIGSCLSGNFTVQDCLSLETVLSHYSYLPTCPHACMRCY